MMNRAFYLVKITAIVIAACMSLASAQAVKLDGKEIRKLLTGNTAIGRLDGKNYRLYFEDDSKITLEHDGETSTKGEWRVDDEVSEYQSILQGEENWTGLFVMKFGDTFYWVSKATPPTPFQVIEGQQLVAE